MITKSKTKFPGITKIATASGDIKYRLIIAVGKRPDGKWIQECYTFGNLTRRSDPADATRPTAAPRTG
jgi:hypothetical protein